MREQRQKINSKSIIDLIDDSQMFLEIRIHAAVLVTDDYIFMILQNLLHSKIEKLRNLLKCMWPVKK